MNKSIIPILRISFFCGLAVGGTEYMLDTGSMPAFIKFPMVTLSLLVFFVILLCIEMLFKSLNTIKYLMLPPEEQAKVDALEALPLTEQPYYKKVMRWLTKSKPIANEGELLLDHNYDGIKELDNELPPWWVYSFYITIVFGLIYLVRFHVVGDYTQTQEFNTEMAIAQKEVEEYLKTAPDLMDKEKVTLLTEAKDLAEGKALFQTNCVACHRADGGGQIGPNLTDKNWILGGGIKNVFNTIMEGGRDGKGMVAWKAVIKPTEVQKVASYVLSLQGTNPKDAKAAEPEAKVYEEAGAADAKVAALNP